MALWSPLDQPKLTISRSKVAYGQPLVFTYLNINDSSRIIGMLYITFHFEVSNIIIIF